MIDRPNPPRKKPTTTPARKRAAKPVSYTGNPNYRGRGHKRSGGGGSWRPERRKVIILLTRVFIACFIIGGLSIVWFARNLPDIRSIDTIRKQQGITIQAADGHTIANYGDVYGEYIPYDQLPKSLIQAVIATEDRRFFEHHGIDLFGIARAIFTNVTHGQLRQGASTVTQQVAKNVFLTPERTLSRKVQEALLALWLEGRFSKKEIMAIYLNRVYLGSGTFGVDAASKRYFNKSARDLTLEESALLAGLLKAPSRYSPAANSARARDRMHQVLVNMVDAGYLKEKQVKISLTNYAQSPSRQTETGGDVRYYTDWVLDEIPNYIGQVEEDLVVTTTMDAKLQAQAQDALQTVVSAEGPAKNISQGALVAMTPEGAVKALVGGMSYNQSQYNRASQAKRQPGSVFKIFVYLAALEAGMTPDSIVEDAPITLQVGNKTWSPDNYSNGKYLGEIPMVVALRNSLNTVSVRLSQYTGVSRVAQMAMRLGVPNIPARPSIALGAVEATLLEMTGAFAHMPNKGFKVDPYAITSVHTRAGKELYKRAEPTQETVLANGTVQMMNYMLLDVVRRGTGVKAGLGARPAAGKTGTSQDFKDAWFIGFTGQMVAGVWVGNDDNKSMKKVTGGEVPAKIWHNFMQAAMEGQPVVQIPNSAASSDGLFPWLFGGQANPAPESGAPTTIPEDAPFGMPSAPLDQGAAPARQVPSEQQEGGDVLTPQFWNKLMDKAPTIDKKHIEYSYPGGAERHRR